MGLTLVVPGRRVGFTPIASLAGSSGQGWEGEARCQLHPWLLPSPLSLWVRAEGGWQVLIGSVSFCLDSCRNLSFNALKSLSWKTVQGLSLQQL